MPRLQLMVYGNDGRALVSLAWGESMAGQIVEAMRGKGSVELFDLDSGLTLARADVDPRAVAHVAPVIAPARAAPGSGDPGDPGLGKPPRIETGGPDAPGEG